MKRIARTGLVLLAGAMAVPALAAQAATGGRYSGKTSQGRAITFSVGHGRVTGLDFTINDRCPDGHILRTHAHGFPPLPVGLKGRFGGKFGPKGQPTVVSGKVGAHRVTGTLSDRTRSPRSHQLCRSVGVVTFTAKHA